MNQFSLSNEVLQERLQQARELEILEQFRCPINPNHKLSDKEKLLNHIHTCKELKLPNAKRIVYKCQFYMGHLFIDQGKKRQHELQCPWGKLPGSVYNETQNAIIEIAPGATAKPSQPAGKQIVTQTQQANYEYALKKGLINKSKQEPIPQDGFEFNKNFKVVDQIIDQLIYKNLQDQLGVQSVISFNGNTIAALPLNQEFPSLISKRLPYNQYFRSQSFFKEEYKNQIINILKQKQSPNPKYLMQGSIRFNLLDSIVNCPTYEKYLEVQLDVRQYSIQEFVLCQNIVNISYDLMYYQIQDQLILTVSRQSLLKYPLKQNPKLIDFLCTQTHYVLFRIPITETLKGLLSNVINFEQKMIQEETDVDLFKQTIDVDLQKLIGQYKAESQMIAQQIVEETMVEESLQKQLEQLEHQKKDILNNELLITENIKKSKQEILDYDLKFKQLHHHTDKTNERAIRLRHDQLNTQFINRQIELKNNQTNMAEEELKMDEQLQESRKENQKLIGDINNMENELKKYVRQTKLLSEQKSEMPKLRQSKYYSSSEINFNDGVKKVKCKSCKERNIDVIFAPCNHATLCHACHDLVESVIPHVCVECEQPIKRTYHFRWETETK